MRIPWTQRRHACREARTDAGRGEPRRCGEGATEMRVGPPMGWRLIGEPLRCAVQRGGVSAASLAFLGRFLPRLGGARPAGVAYFLPVRAGRKLGWSRPCGQTTAHAQGQFRAKLSDLTGRTSGLGLPAGPRRAGVLGGAEHASAAEYLRLPALRVAFAVGRSSRAPGRPRTGGPALDGPAGAARRLRPAVKHESPVGRSAGPPDRGSPSPGPSADRPVGRTA
jgi:hypothetical protein